MTSLFTSFLGISLATYIQSPNKFHWCCLQPIAWIWPFAATALRKSCFLWITAIDSKIVSLLLFLPAPAAGRELLLSHTQIMSLPGKKPPLASSHRIKSKILSMASKLAHDLAGYLTISLHLSVSATLAFQMFVEHGCYMSRPFYCCSPSEMGFPIKPTWSVSSTQVSAQNSPP